MATYYEFVHLDGYTYDSKNQHIFRNTTETRVTERSNMDGNDVLPKQRTADIQSLLEDSSIAHKMVNYI